MFIRLLICQLCILMSTVMDSINKIEFLNQSTIFVVSLPKVAKRERNKTFSFTSSSFPSPFFKSRFVYYNFFDGHV